MKLAITGAVGFRDYDHFCRVVQAIPVPITLLVTGGRDGAEKLARRYARDHDLSILIHHVEQTGDIEWMKTFDLLLASDADNLLAFHYPGTQTHRLLTWAAGVKGKRLNTVFLTPDPDHEPGVWHEAAPHAIAARYGEEIE